MTTPTLFYGASFNASFLYAPFPSNVRSILESLGSLTWAQQEVLCESRFAAAAAHPADPHAADLLFPFTSADNLRETAQAWVFPILITLIVVHGLKAIYRWMLYNQRSNLNPKASKDLAKLIEVNSNLLRYDMWLGFLQAVAGIIYFFLINFLPVNNKFAIWSDWNTLSLTLLAISLLMTANGLIQFWSSMKRVNGSYESSEAPNFASLLQKNKTGVEGENSNIRVWMMVNTIMIAALFIPHIFQFSTQRALLVSLGVFFYAVATAWNAVLLDIDFYTNYNHKIAEGCTIQVIASVQHAVGALLILLAYTRFDSSDLPCGFAHLSDDTNSSWVLPFAVMIVQFAVIIYWAYRIATQKEETGGLASQTSIEQGRSEPFRLMQTNATSSQFSAGIAVRVG